MLKKNGWVKILTYNGEIGYIKENKIGEKTYVRINMEEEDFSTNEPDTSNMIEIGKEVLSSETLSNFDLRKEIVEDIISEMITKETYTVSLNLEDVESESEYLERLIIELIPRLKEIGGSLIIENNSILSDSFLEENNL